MNNDKKPAYKIQLIVSAIGLVGVLGTALISNWKTVFPDNRVLINTHKIISNYCSIKILTPTEGSEVGPSVNIDGKSNNCNQENTIYSLALQDEDGDYYKQENLSISNSGNWSAIVYLGKSWSGKKVTIKAISYPDTMEWVNGLNSLSSEITYISDVKLIVK